MLLSRRQQLSLQDKVGDSGCGVVGIDPSLRKAVYETRHLIVAYAAMDTRSKHPGYVNHDFQEAFDRYLPADGSAAAADTTF